MNRNKEKNGVYCISIHTAYILINFNILEKSNIEFSILHAVTIFGSILASHHRQNNNFLYPAWLETQFFVSCL